MQLPVFARDRRPGIHLRRQVHDRGLGHKSQICHRNPSPHSLKLSRGIQHIIQRLLHQADISSLPSHQLQLLLRGNICPLFDLLNLRAGLRDRSPERRPKVHLPDKVRIPQGKVREGPDKVIIRPFQLLPDLLIPCRELIIPPLCKHISHQVQLPISELPGRTQRLKKILRDLDRNQRIIFQFHTLNPNTLIQPSLRLRLSIGNLPVRLVLKVDLFHSHESPLTAPLRSLVFLNQKYIIPKVSLRKIRRVPELAHHLLNLPLFRLEQSRTPLEQCIRFQLQGPLKPGKLIQNRIADSNIVLKYLLPLARGNINSLPLQPIT